MGFGNCSLFGFVLRSVHSCYAIILMVKRELVALLSLSTWCLMIVVWLFLAVPWACLQFVIVVCPDHTHFFEPKLHFVTFDFDLFKLNKLFLHNTQDIVLKLSHMMRKILKFWSF